VPPNKKTEASDRDITRFQSVWMRRAGLLRRSRQGGAGLTDSTGAMIKG